MKHILSLLVNNSSGVLSQVVGLFTRRGYNIDSLSVAETDDPTRSVITLQVKEETGSLPQIKKQILKLIHVIRVTDLTGEESLKRELILMVIRVDKSKRNEITNLVKAFQGKILDITANFMMLEFDGAPRTMSSFVKIFREYGIVSIARTGTIALKYPSTSTK